MNDPQRSELLDTIGNLFDGTLEPQNIAQLTQRLLEDEEAYALYARLVRLDVGLAWSCGTRPKGEILAAGPAVTLDKAPSLQEHARPRRTKAHTLPLSQRRNRNSFFSWPILQRVAVVALCFYGTFVLVAWNLRSLAERQNAVSHQAAAKQVDEPNAVLTRADDATWKISSADIDQNSNPSLQVNAGLAELTFAKGAKVVVQGPAEFDVCSSSRGFLRRGKLVAVVPPQAVGFTIATPNADIVDLGTEFGVEVDDRGEAEVHVFQGRVVAELPASEKQSARRVELKASEAARFVGGDAPVSRLTATPDRFQRSRAEIARAPQLSSIKPDSFKGLQLWLKADQGVYSQFTDDGDFANDTFAKPGDRVQAWQDHSGKNHHALQNTQDCRPLFAADRRGMPAMRFDCAQWFERDGTILDYRDPSDFTIMVVVRPTLPAIGQERSVLFGQFNSNSVAPGNRFLAIQPEGMLNYDEFPPVGGRFLTPRGSLPSGGLSIAGILRNGKSRTWLLSSISGTTQDSDASAETYDVKQGGVPTSWRIGALLKGSKTEHFFAGEIYEFLIFDHALSNVELQKLRSYLRSKFFPNANG